MERHEAPPPAAAGAGAEAASTAQGTEQDREHWTPEEVEARETSTEAAASFKEQLEIARRVYGDPEPKFDVFISHAGQQKWDFVAVLREKFTAAQSNLKVFVDKDALKAGDFAEQVMAEAAVHSPAVVVVLSKEFIRKPYPMAELEVVKRMVVDDKVKGKALIVVLHKPLTYDDVSNIKEYYSNIMPDDWAGSEKPADSVLDRWVDTISGILEYTITEPEKKVVCGSLPELAEVTAEETRGKLRELKRLPAMGTPVEQLDLPFVGLALSVSAIKEEVRPGEDGRSNMVLIHGQGGIGKTTAATAAYSELQQEYPLVPTCRVSLDWQAPDIICAQKSILDSLLEQVGIQKIGNQWTDSSGGRAMLQTWLKGRVVLLLIDNVASGKLAEVLPADFMTELGKGSMVLVTSRDSSVAQERQPCNEFRMDGLHNDEAMELFCRHAYGAPSLPAHLAEARKLQVQQVVRTCGGLPLALVTAALYLKSCKDDKSWRKLEAVMSAAFDKPAAEGGAYMSLNAVYREIINALCGTPTGLCLKQLLVDVACTLRGEAWDDVVSHLDGLGQGQMVAHEEIMRLSNLGLITRRPKQEPELMDLRHRHQHPSPAAHALGTVEMHDTLVLFLKIEFKQEKQASEARCVKCTPNKTSLPHASTDLIFLSMQAIPLSGTLLWAAPPSNLRVLHIRHADCIDMVRLDLAGLLHLASVGLFDMASLQELSGLSSCTELERLELRECRQLQAVVDGAQLSNLELLVVDSCPKVAVRNLQGLTQMRALGLKECGVELPTSFSEFSELQWLELQPTIPLLALLSGFAGTPGTPCVLSGLNALTKLLGLKINCDRYGSVELDLSRFRGLRNLWILEPSNSMAICGSDLACYLQQLEQVRFASFLPPPVELLNAIPPSVKTVRVGRHLWYDVQAPYSRGSVGRFGRPLLDRVLAVKAFGNIPPPALQNVTFSPNVLVQDFAENPSKFGKLDTLDCGRLPTITQHLWVKMGPSSRLRQLQHLFTLSNLQELWLVMMEKGKLLDYTDGSWVVPGPPSLLAGFRKVVWLLSPPPERVPGFSWMMSSVMATRGEGGGLPGHNGPEELVLKGLPTESLSQLRMYGQRGGGVNGRELLKLVNPRNLWFEECGFESLPDLEGVGAVGITCIDCAALRTPVSGLPSPLANLLRLRLERCNGVVKLEGLDRLPGLVILALIDMAELQEVHLHKPMRELELNSCAKLHTVSGTSVSRQVGDGVVAALLVGQLVCKDCPELNRTFQLFRSEAAAPPRWMGALG